MQEADKGRSMSTIGMSGECFFLYWLTQVVPDKSREPYDGCVCVCLIEAKPLVADMNPRLFSVVQY